MVNDESRVTFRLERLANQSVVSGGHKHSDRSPAIMSSLFYDKPGSLWQKIDQGLLAYAEKIHGFEEELYKDATNWVMSVTTIALLR